MGYYIEQRYSNFRLPAKYVESATAALIRLLRTQEFLAESGNSRDPELADRIAAIPNPRQRAKEAFKAARWDIYFAVESDENGMSDIDDINFEGQKAGWGEDMALKAIAPYVEDESYIEMGGEQGEIWRYSFLGGELHETEGQVRFGEAQAANRWEQDGLQFARLLAEIYAVGLTDGQIDGLCASMDLDPLDITELFVRAEKAWEEIKETL